MEVRVFRYFLTLSSDISGILAISNTPKTHLVSDKQTMEEMSPDCRDRVLSMACEARG